MTPTAKFCVLYTELQLRYNFARQHPINAIIIQKQLAIDTFIIFMNNPTIIWHNHQTPISIRFDDVYFNTENAIDETKYVFIEGNKIVERFLLHSYDTFVVAETGFGSGLNFLILWHCFLQFRQQNPNHNLKKLKFYSVEKYPLSTQEQMDIYSKTLLGKNESLWQLSKQLRIDTRTNYYSFENVELMILFDYIDFYPAFLKQQNCMVDAWFFDGFSPQKNADMWRDVLFKSCYELTQSNGTFATFTAASFVRKNLISAGFAVYKRKGYGVKREMLVGQKRIPNRVKST